MSWVSVELAIRIMTGGIICITEAKTFKYSHNNIIIVHTCTCTLAMTHNAHLLLAHNYCSVYIIIIIVY